MGRLKEAYKDAYKNKAYEIGLDARLMLAAEELPSGIKALEVGLGNGTFSREIHKIKKNIELYGIDVSESAVKSCQSYLVEGCVRDLSNEQLPWDDDFFDSVISLEVFEHLQNPYKALSEIQRVLKPGGKLILSVPNRLGGHLMLYPGLEKPKNLRLFLMQNYFYVEKIKPFGILWHTDNLGQYISQRFKNPLLVRICVFIVGSSLKLIQIILSLIKLKGYWTYWCYTFVSVNRKNEMDAPLWQKQIEQTTNQENYPGWYHPYYHKRPRKRLKLNR